MVKILTDLATNLESDYPVGYTFRVLLIADSRSAYTWTVDAGTDVITTSSNHGFLSSTTRVQFSSTGSLPVSTPQIVAGTDYLIDTVPASNTITVKTVAGVAIDFSGTGTGTHTITDVAPSKVTSSVAEWVRKEVANYDGLAGRFDWVPVASTADTGTGVVTIQSPLTIDNTAGTGGLSFNMALLIKGGSATRGNTTGTVSDYYDFGTTQLIPAGSIYTLTVVLKRRNAA